MALALGAALQDLQLLASPASGDAGPDGSFSTSVQAIFSPAHEGGSPIAGKVHWDFGDGTSADTRALKDGTAPGPAFFSHAFAAGDHLVTATASDAAGHVASASMTLAVYPSLAASISILSVSGNALQYAGTTQGGDGHLLAWRWTFSDGTTAAGPVVTHTFAAGTTPGATLTVTDGTGTTAAAAA